MSTELERISELAKQDRTLQFTSLAHLLTVERLGEAYHRLRKDASPGVDGITVQEYEQDLAGNLQGLHRRLREGHYRAQPVRRVYIEQEGKRRPLGISALEDKIVQRAVVSILDAIYEQDFLPCSFGYRPGRSAQDALNEGRAGYGKSVRPDPWGARRGNSPGYPETCSKLAA